MSVVGTVAALVANYSLEIERQDGQVEKRDLSFLEEENKQDPERNLKPQEGGLGCKPFDSGRVRSGSAAERQLNQESGDEGKSTC